MMNGLLISTTPEVVMLLISYGVCAAIIVAALILIVALKWHTKKQMRSEAVKKACEKAKKCAEKLLEQKSRAKLFGATNLMHLNRYLAEAAWLAFQIAEVKKDILFEGIAGTLDGLATEISNESENGYIPQEEYEADVKKALAGLNGVLEKLNTIIARR